MKGAREVPNRFKAPCARIVKIKLRALPRQDDRAPGRTALGLSRGVKPGRANRNGYSVITGFKMTRASVPN